MTDKSYTTKVLEITENGDAIIEIPQELMDNMGWLVGDILDFELTKDNSVIITNLTHIARQGKKIEGKD
jgi:hypothetical protein